MKQLPIPPSLWEELIEFVQPGRHGTIELNVKDGRIVGMKIVKLVKPTANEKDDWIAA